jgi:immunity protein 63 of polymorphic toxin system
MSRDGHREVLTARREVLEAEIDRLAAVIGLRGADVVGFDTHIDGGHPYIEIADDGLLHVSARERGKLLLDRTTRDPDDLLYWSFEIATRQLASEWELHHRDESQDSRVGWWARQAELLLRLDPVWAQRWRRELEERQPQDVALMPALPPASAGGS